MENKKADITSAQLITVIILVGSFALILIVIFLYPWGEADREVCHYSIVSRNSVNIGDFDTVKIVPLKCRTEKICITTSSNEKCSDAFGDSTKENPVQLKKVKDREDILDVLADAHYDCHVLVGEGKLDFEPHKLFNEPYGLICSRISFSKDAQDILKKEALGDISYLELYQHMSNKQTKDKGNYLQFIYNIKSAQEFMNFFEKQFKEMQNFEPEHASFFSSLFSNEVQPSIPGPDNTVIPPILPLTSDETQKVSDDYNKFKEMNLSDWKINSSKEQAIVTQVIPKGKLESYAIAGGILVSYGAVALLTIVAPPAGIVTGAIAMAISSTYTAVGVAAVSGISLYYTSPGGQIIYVAPTLYEYNADVLKGLNIYEFSFAP
jgi:hypothetical protein